MGFRDWLIKKLELELEDKGGFIDLEEVSDEEREKLFVQFGEGDKNLTNFLRTAYKHGCPSMFCCSGHSVNPPYVVLKVTDENIDKLRKLGKVLSKYGIATNFDEHYVYGKRVLFNALKSSSTEWLDVASKALEEPELFDSSNPEIFYHEEMTSGYKPFAFGLKKKLLAFLKRKNDSLPERK